MSKLKIPLALFALTILFFIFSKPAYAERVVIFTPDIVKHTDTSISVTINATTPDDEFNPSITYHYQAWKDGESPHSCGLGLQGTYPNNVTPDPSSTKSLTVSWPLNRDCQLEDGKWNFAIWPENTIDPPSQTKIYSYSVQPEKEPASIAAAKSEYQIGDPDVEVVLSNAADGYSYYFWWDGASVRFAAPSQVKSSTGGSFNIKLGGGLQYSPIPTKPGTAKLCMIEMPVWNPPLIPALLPSSCPPAPQSAIFTFKEKVVTQNVQCKITPETPSNIGDVVLSGSNLPLQDTYNLSLLQDNNVIKAVSQSTKDSDTISAVIGSSLKIGKYSATITRTSNAQQMCKVDFSVGDINGGGANPPSINKPVGVQAGGIQCNNGNGILTAIGCIPSDPAELVAAVLKFATGAGGGIALLLMISGAFKMITSAGNPDAVKKGQEQFTSAIIGLLFIIFSVLLLQIIGVDILGLPGFLPK